MNDTVWNKHYTRDKSLLLYPDENLVRLLQSSVHKDTRSSLVACDIGCGSGRHSLLLESLGINNIIATDISHNASSVKASLGFFSVECTTAHIPLKNNSVDIAICWGSLHYAAHCQICDYIQEIYRIMKKGSLLFGTLRSEHDTFFNRVKKIDDRTYRVSTEDLDESTVTFYSSSDIPLLFSSFTEVTQGSMQRTQLGSTRIIAHHFFRVKK